MKLRVKDKILIFGGSGQIGSKAKLLLSKNFKVIAPAREEVDITSKSQIENFIKSCNPNQILYSAGFTSIDNAPKYPGETFILNAGALYYISDLAKKKGIPIHYLSTETVFGGSNSHSPYSENDQPNPLPFLAQTKRAGELIILNSSSKNSVVRLIMCYSSVYDRKMDIARLALSKVLNGESFLATTDQKINPIYVDHLISALEKILTNRASGIFHVGATDYTTPFDFCRKVIKAFNLDEKLILPTTFSKFSKKRQEPRPKHQWLDVNKFLKTFGPDSLHTIDEGIAVFKKNFK